MWTELMKKHRIEQLVDKPTQKTKLNILDYIFVPEHVNIPFIKVDSSAFCTNFDHFAVIFEVDSYYQRTKEEIFKRKETNKNSELHAIQDSLIYITRKNVLKHRPNFQDSCKLITSGVKTWKEAAKKGYWISGTSDSLGQSEITSMKSLFGIKNIIKLTFKNEFVNNTNSIDLYELKKPNFPNDFEKRDNFF